jgi:hypothetical protein
MAGSRKVSASGDRVAERHYEGVWKQLKKDKKVILALTPAWHPRVKKAVCKEKHMDYGYKFICDAEGRKSELTFNSNGSQLTITLNEMLLTRLENL